MAADLPEGWKLLPPGWIAIPAEPSQEQWMEAQGTWLDMGWDATTCLAARIQALIGITRREYEAAVAALPSGVKPPDARDAARYRWLRQQHWNEAPLCVVMQPRQAVKLGHDCPALARLDAAIDEAIGADGVAIPQTPKES